MQLLTVFFNGKNQPYTQCVTQHVCPRKGSAQQYLYKSTLQCKVNKNFFNLQMLHDEGLVVNVIVK
jgi:hypothetical protein